MKPHIAMAAGGLADLADNLWIDEEQLRPRAALPAVETFES